MALLVQGGVVDPGEQRQVGVRGRCRDDDLPYGAAQVRVRLRPRGELPGGLEHKLHLFFLPGDIGGSPTGRDAKLVVADRQAPLRRPDGERRRAVDGIVSDQVRERAERNQIVGRGQHDILPSGELSGQGSADPAQAVDADPDFHG